MTRLRELLTKHRDKIAYLLFGGLTTVVNIAVYYACYRLMGLPNVVAVAVAWVIAVAFAFITNKLWVFESKSFDGKTLAHEIPSFLGARVLTGLLDVAVMYLAVDVLHWNAALWKLISNVLVVILNYVASTLIIFSQDGDKHTTN